MEGLSYSRSLRGPSPQAVNLATVDQHEVMLHRAPRQNPQTGIIIAKIEEILAANVDALRERRVMAIPLRSRRTGRVQRVRFPSSRATEARKFTALLQILHLSHESLVAGRVITKRAIYYQNPELFGSQRYVNELIDDIAFTFGGGRDALNIVATSKGLIAGALSVTINNGSVLSCNPNDGQGILLPDSRVITSVDVGAIKWLLVIEKEATFRGLVTSRFYETAMVGPGALVTAKGYPDLSTRQFLHKLHTTFPTLPMYGLVDFDPDGVKIMLTYKNGSRSLQHEENTTLNRLLWIGPRSNDILGGYHRGSPSTEETRTRVASNIHSQESPVFYPGALLYPRRRLSPTKVTLPLKATDRRLALRLLSSTFVKDECMETLSIIREVQIMLMLNLKAEIQAVDEAGDLTEWLDSVLAKRLGAM